MSTFRGDVVWDAQAVNALFTSANGPVYRHLSVIGDDIKAEAQDLVGVDTGRLRDSIVKRFVNQGNRIVVQVGSEVDYAIHHHEPGQTRDWPGNPFLEDALRNVTQ